MDERTIGPELERDLLRAATSGKVLYLEGQTDVMMLAGLLGRDPPTVIPEEGLPLDGIWVRGLSGRTGSGSKAVEQRVRLAGKLELRGIRGIIDGDGRDHEMLAAGFDPPFAGPLYTWKAYCLENLLAQCDWPVDFGPASDWRTVLGTYGWSRCTLPRRRGEAPSIAAWSGQGTSVVREATLKSSIGGAGSLRPEAGQRTRSGSTTRNTEPRLTWLSTSMVPPSMEQNLSTMVRPRPVPP